MHFYWVTVYINSKRHSLPQKMLSSLFFAIFVKWDPLLAIFFFFLVPKWDPCLMIFGAKVTH